MLTLRNIEPAPLLGSKPETALSRLDRKLQECMVAADEAHGEARTPILKALLDQLRSEMTSQLEAIRDDIADAVIQDEDITIDEARAWRAEMISIGGRVDE